jgi:hypothetical protein
MSTTWGFGVVRVDWEHRTVTLEARGARGLVATRGTLALSLLKG